MSGLSYDDYAPAYALGYGNYKQGRRFDDESSRLEAEWDRVKQRSRLTWHDAKVAARAAWDRLDGPDRRS